MRGSPATADPELPKVLVIFDIKIIDVGAADGLCKAEDIEALEGRAHSIYCNASAPLSASKALFRRRVSLKALGIRIDYVSIINLDVF
jgi:hypothetical protein